MDNNSKIIQFLSKNGYKNYLSFKWENEGEKVKMSLLIAYQNF